jgi:hypothetical protein
MQRNRLLKLLQNDKLHASRNQGRVLNGQMKLELVHLSANEWMNEWINEWNDDDIHVCVCTHQYYQYYIAFISLWQNIKYCAMVLATTNFHQ